jgi:uncharacterized repeat protein (TIGR01451 family)
MNDAQAFFRRLLAAGLAGSGMVTFAGCSITSALHQEPDHVYSTTTPQMLEHEAGDQPVPVPANYPEQAGARGFRNSADSGLLTLRRVSLQDAVDESGDEGDEAVVRLTPAFRGKPFARTASREARGGVRPSSFHPAEPRLEMSPQGTPLQRMETIAPSATADLYPDEYLYDGGDREDSAAMHARLRSGIESEDTVAGYVDGTGTAKTVASNRVAIYAPRFGSVRSVTGLVADTKIDKASGARDAITIGNLKTGRMAQENIAETALTEVENHNRVDGIISRKPAMQSQNRHRPVQSTKVDEGHEGRVASGVQTFNRRQAFVLAQQRQNAEIWTREQFPVITASTDSASEVAAVFKVQQKVGLEDQNRGGVLHLVKLADRESAMIGDVIRFTIRFENTGDLNLHDVRIVDNLTPRLEYVEGSATIDEQHPGAVMVEPNGEGSSVLTFTLDGPLQGHKTGVITFEARVR